MGLNHSPSTVMSGLILNLDAGNPNSYSATVSAPTLTQVDVFLVGGGGGGGGGQISWGGGGGGGAGGVVYRAGHSLALLSASLTVTVGTGGAGGLGGNTTPVLGSNGTDSTFAGLTALGGGGGGTGQANAGNGGSGGGVAGFPTPFNIRPPGQATDATQGKEGGANGSGTPFCGAGGGGAGGPGVAGGVTGAGGPGVFYGDTFGTSVGAAGFFAGGGGGGVYQTPAAGTSGGIGGGGGGTLTAGVNGTANTGGGGGGGGINNNGPLTYLAGSGGSGVVIIRYPGAQQAVGGNTVTTSNNVTTHIFTSSGTFNREIWRDISGRGNNATLVNSPTFNSANSGSLVFNGTNQYVTSLFATSSGQAVTYCGWLYSTETTATYRNFVDSGLANPMIWWNTSGQIEFDASSYTTTAVYRNQWVYVALSKPSGSSAASYYVNGVLVGTGGAYTTPALTPTWFNRAAAQTWIGNCSNVQAYNRALSADEVNQNFNALRGRFGI